MRWRVLLVHAGALGLALLLSPFYVEPPAAGAQSVHIDGLRAFLVLAALALAASGATAGWWRRPLKRLSDTLEAMRAGDFSAPPLGRRGPGELGALEAKLGEWGRLVAARLEESAALCLRLETILDSIAEGIMATDLQGRVVLANRALAELCGSGEALAGRRPVEILRAGTIEAHIAQVLESGENRVREFSLPGGAERHLEVHLAPMEKDGVRVGVVAVFYDITRLRRLERLRRDFVANVSHELRTPLTAIKGCAETLVDGALDDRRAATRFVEVIGAHADRLARLLDDLLSLSRLESERLEVQGEACLLGALLESCAGAVAQAAAAKRIALRVPRAGEVQVWCERKLVEQALINLLDNALKYTPEGGQVQVRIRPFETLEPEKRAAPRLEVLAPAAPAARIALEVADSGMGIPSGDLGRVFERFYRVDKGRSRAMGGTGLGLSIVRHICEVHGEGLYVESELGKGTLFGMTLSLARGGDLDITS